MSSTFLERIASEVTNMGGTLSIVIVLLTFPLVAVNQNHPYPKTIPIGAIFHKDAVEVEVGFNYAIVSHKESEGRETFELEATIDMIDVSSSYELTSAICSRMESGVFAVFGMKNISSLSVIQSLARKFHMPYLSPSLSKVSSDGGSEFELHMKPSYTDAMIHIVKSYGWTSFYYIYDSDTGLLRLQELYKFQEKNPGIYDRILPRRLVDVYNAHDELRLIDKIENQVMMKAIVVDLSSQGRYQVFLKQIAEVGMNKHGYHYLFGGLGFNELDLDSFRHGGVNITGFQLLNYSSPKLQDFLNKWESLPPRIWPGAGQKNN